jgi:hypothetical protein
MQIVEDLLALALHPTAQTNVVATNLTVEDASGAMNYSKNALCMQNTMLNKPPRRYRLDTRVIDTDLSVERPLWPLSAYGPGLNAPRQLIEGDVEISPEEMRYQAYLLKSQGNDSQIVSGL